MNSIIYTSNYIPDSKMDIAINKLKLQCVLIRLAHQKEIEQKNLYNRFILFLNKIFKWDVNEI